MNIVILYGVVILIVVGLLIVFKLFRGFVEQNYDTQIKAQDDANKKQDESAPDDGEFFVIERAKRDCGGELEFNFRNIYRYKSCYNNSVGAWTFSKLEAYCQGEKHDKAIKLIKK